jgi:hypothetical protein
VWDGRRGCLDVRVGGAGPYPSTGEPAQAATDPPPPQGPRLPAATLAKTTKASFSGAPGCMFVWENVAFLKFTYK